MNEGRGDELELRGTTVLDRPWWPARAAMLGFFVAALVGTISGSGLVFGAAIALLFVAVWGSSRKPPLAGAPHTRLLVGEDAIRSGSFTIVERSEIVDGTLWPATSHGKLVRLRRRAWKPPVEIAVASLDDGRALLEKMRLAPPHARATFRTPSRAFGRARFWGGVAAFFAYVLALGAILPRVPYPGVVIAALFSLPILLVAALVASFWPTNVTFGNDGVLVRWFGRRKTIPYADVTSFSTVRGRQLRFHLKDGTHYDLVTERGATGFAHDAIVERLHGALERTPIDVGPLERRGRGVGEWISALRALTKRAEGFRDVPLDAARLWRVLEDPQTSPTAKAGAAVALSPTLDDHGKQRLRVVREASVSPKLRLALDAAEQNDDESLCAALDELDEERAAR